MAQSSPATDRPVVEALVKKAWVAVKPVVEALPNWLETNRLPEAVLWTMPATFREDKVVEPVIQAVPPTDKPVVEALVANSWVAVRPVVEALSKVV